MLDTIIASMSVDQLQIARCIWMGIFCLVEGCIICLVFWGAQFVDSKILALLYIVGTIVVMTVIPYITMMPIGTKIDNAIDAIRESETEYAYEIQIEINVDDFGIDEGSN